MIDAEHQVLFSFHFLLFGHNSLDVSQLFWDSISTQNLSSEGFFEIYILLLTQRYFRCVGIEFCLKPCYGLVAVGKLGFLQKVSASCRGLSCRGGVSHATQVYMQNIHDLSTPQNFESIPHVKLRTRVRFSSVLHSYGPTFSPFCDDPSSARKKERKKKKQETRNFRIMRHTRIDGYLCPAVTDWRFLQS